MWPVPIAPVKPDGQFGGAFAEVCMCSGIGPLAKCGLNEAFHLSVGLGRMGPGADVADLEAPSFVA